LAARWVRMVLQAAARERGYFAFCVGDASGFIERLAPAAGPMPMLARISRDDLSLEIDSAEGRIELISGFDRALVFGRRALGIWRGAGLDFDGVELFPDGGRAATRRYRKHVEAAQRHDSAWDGAFMAAHSEIVRGWPEAAPLPPPSGEPRIAVALHLYYTELWGEIETLLGRWRRPFRLFLSLNAPDTALESRVAAAFPCASVRVVENRGRDIRPFLVWLEEGAFDGFAAVCKIHGKRSFGGGRLPAFGDALRRVNFFDLIADPDRVERIVARFAGEPNLGLVGSAHFFGVSSANAPKDMLGANRGEAEKLAARLAAPLTEPEFDFFEGTMFWVRPEALAPLRALRLSQDGFGAEAGKVDGAVEHALERLFNHVVRAAGYRVETASS
jgi:hypothetical protein